MCVFFRLKSVSQLEARTSMRIDIVDFDRRMQTVPMEIECPNRWLVAEWSGSYRMMYVCSTTTSYLTTWSTEIGIIDLEIRISLTTAWSLSLVSCTQPNLFPKYAANGSVSSYNNATYYGTVDRECNNLQCVQLFVLRPVCRYLKNKYKTIWDELVN